MSAFEPLGRIVSTAFPYWLIFAVLVSLLSALVAKRSNRSSFLPEVIVQFGATFGFLFMALGIYIQLTGRAMSFVELLPSSFLVLAGISATLLILVRSKEDIGLGMSIVTIALPTVVLGTFLAFLVSFAPKLIAIQWHLLKLLWGL
jgi:uncharacterized membrane protein YhaH (DUF805 family)